MADKTYRFSEIHTLPKGERLSYFWTYYKLHTIIIAAVLIAVVSTVVSLATRVKPDVQLLLMSNTFSSTEVETLETQLCQLPIDNNGDGKNVASIYDVAFADAETTDAYVVMQAVTALSASDYVLLLVGQGAFDYLMGMDVLADESGNPATTDTVFTLPASEAPGLGLPDRDDLVLCLRARPENDDGYYDTQLSALDVIRQG